MRYIDADKLIEHIKNMPWKMDSASEITKVIFMSIVEEAPTADVVPKSEVERVYYNLQAVLEERAETKREIAREIFEELESICLKHIDRYNRYIMCCEEFAELKKKYTEDQSDG